jgi:hypothetical protein
MKSRTSALLLVLGLATGSLSAQVPVDGQVRFTFDRDLGTPQSVGVELIDVATGTATPLTGLSSAALQSNAGMLDPITGELIVGGIGLSADWIRRVVVNGSMGMDSMIVDLGPGWPVRALDYDENGHFYCMDHSYVYRVDRATTWMMGMPSINPTLVTSILIAQSATATFNAMAYDRGSRKLYAVAEDAVGVTAAGIYEVDPSVLPAVGPMVADIGNQGFEPSLTGMAFDGNDLFYLSAESTTGDSVLVWDRAAGTVARVPGAPAVKLNGIHLDRKTGLLHLVGSGRDGAPGDSDTYTLDPSTGTLTQVTSSTGIGAPSDVLVNDLTDTTTVFPTRPVASVDNHFEFAAHGYPGEIAGIGITGVGGLPLLKPLLLGVGTCDGGGFYSMSLDVPAGGFTAGTTLTIRSGRIDAATMSLVLGDSVTVVVK